MKLARQAAHERLDVGVGAELPAEERFLLAGGESIDQDDDLVGPQGDVVTEEAEAVIEVRGLDRVMGVLKRVTALEQLDQAQPLLGDQPFDAVSGDYRRSHTKVTSQLGEGVRWGGLETEQALAELAGRETDDLGLELGGFGGVGVDPREHLEDQLEPAGAPND